MKMIKECVFTEKDKIVVLRYMKNKTLCIYKVNMNRNKERQFDQEVTDVDGIMVYKFLQNLIKWQDTDLDKKIEGYKRKKFNSNQLEEIIYGLVQGLDIDKYADKKYNADQMKQIRLGLGEGLDVRKYLNNNFTFLQMYEIRLGLRDDIDVSTYAKKDYSWEVMEDLRLHLRKFKKEFKIKEGKIK